MIRFRIAILAVLLVTATAAAAQTAVAPPLTSEVIAFIQIHGNNATPEAEVLQLIGLQPGEPFGPDTLKDVQDRLRATGRFEGVEVRKRFASIVDPSRIALVIIVDEHPSSILASEIEGAAPRITRRGTLGNFMVMPIVTAEEGYGLTYGARFAYVGMTGRRSRVSFPVTWGGDKRVAAEFETSMTRGPLSRVEVGTSLLRRKNLGYGGDEDRGRVWFRAERAVSILRFGGTAAWEHVSYGGADDALKSAGGDVVLDTRSDPTMARNAVYARAAWTRISRRAGAPIDRIATEAHGYLGLYRQMVLAARIERDSANQPLPPYLQPFLGGWSTLRGFKAGSFADDRRVSASLELRLPVSSPLSVGRAGFSIFYDVGTTYAYDQRFRDQALHRGAGVGAWWSMTVLRLGMAVARGEGNTRVHFTGGLTF